MSLATLKSEKFLSGFESLIEKIDEAEEAYKALEDAIKFNLSITIPYMHFREKIVALAYEIVGFLEKNKNLFEGERRSSIEESIKAFKSDITNFLSYMFAEKTLEYTIQAQTGKTFIEHIKNSLEYTIEALKLEQKKIFIREVLKRVEIFPKFTEMRELKKKRFEEEALE
jgi:hypothetical protein